MDEWYNFQHPVTPAVNGNTTVADYSPRARQVHVLATVDESTYGEDDGNTIDDDHPVAWCSDFDGGRSWYTAMGHTAASFADADFLDHLLGGLQTAAGAGDCGEHERDVPPVAADFEKVTLNNDTNAPMEIDIADDGRAFYIELGQPVTGGQATRPRRAVGRTRTRSHRRSRARSPSRSTRTACWASSSRRTSTSPGHIYMPTRRWPERRRSPRSTGSRASRSARPARSSAGSEIPIYEWTPPARGVLPHRRLARLRPRRQPLPLHGRQHEPVRPRLQPDRRAARPPELGRPAHVGEHEQPERQDPPDPPARGAARLARASGRPTTIPRGNMFPPGTAQTLPEIYAMGFRNPFRIHVDPVTDWSSWATTARTPARRARPAARRARSSSTSSRSRASTAGPTASARTSRTTTSRTRATRARAPTTASTTAPRRSTTRPTTRA